MATFVDSIPSPSRGAKPRHDYLAAAKLALTKEAKAAAAKKQLLKLDSPADFGSEGKFVTERSSKDAKDEIIVASFAQGLKKVIAENNLDVRVSVANGEIFLQHGKVEKRPYNRKVETSTNAPSSDELAEITPEAVAALDTEAKS